ncbi:hypothetical protein BDZ94DRAFT_1306313 [Collybia nuda]|uniref:Homeobox domain-containing protein n=1 Tax=Collybia nuda TaxID=64659 RepID=A0A9P5YEE5_9AGAR|nr:hypothetical protein BDZ94DRAFT_1306313 [Collybia nuda]
MSIKTYTSTSEVIKTCARKRKATSNSCVRSPASLETSSREHDAEPQVYQPMALAHLDELAKIWDADKRTPSVLSRRAWALARNLKPEQVHRWWYRRKKVAKKARITIPNGSYELPIGTPPTIDQLVKEEPDAPKLSGKISKVSQCTIDPWGRSNPALTIIDPIRPSSCGFKLSSPSNTVIGRLRSSQSHRHYSAYSPSRPLPALFMSHDMASKSLNPMDQTLSSSPLPSSSPVSALPEPCAFRQTASVIVDRIAGSTQPICNQGVNKISCYTCPLCTSTASSSGIPERNPLQAPMTPELTQGSPPRLQIQDPRIQLIILKTI